jgi:hypothetical protein
VLGGGSACGIRTCEEAAPSHTSLPWPFKLGEFFAAHEVIGVGICIVGTAAAEGASNPPCEILLDVRRQIDTHNYELQANGAPCLENPIFEMRGRWTLTSGAIEIVHL